MACSKNIFSDQWRPVAPRGEKIFVTFLSNLLLKMQTSGNQKVAFFCFEVASRFLNKNFVGVTYENIGMAQRNIQVARQAER